MLKILRNLQKIIRQRKNQLSSLQFYRSILYRLYCYKVSVGYLNRGKFTRLFAENNRIFPKKRSKFSHEEGIVIEPLF